VPAALRRIGQRLGIRHLPGQHGWATSTPSCPTGCSPAAPKTPSTAPVGSTSTTPPPGCPTQHRRTTSGATSAQLQQSQTSTRRPAARRLAQGHIVAEVRLYPGSRGAARRPVCT
jgi:hypothetical protein